jgi:hypothetical protein
MWAYYLLIYMLVSARNLRFTLAELCNVQFNVVLEQLFKNLKKSLRQSISNTIMKVMRNILKDQIKVEQETIIFLLI